MSIEEKFKQALAEAWPVGTKFSRSRKTGRQWLLHQYTVTKIHVTFDQTGNLVKVFYEAEMPYIGGPITYNNICAVTIARGNPIKPEEV